MVLQGNLWSPLSLFFLSHLFSRRLSLLHPSRYSLSLSAHVLPRRDVGSVEKAERECEREVKKEREI